MLVTSSFRPSLSRSARSRPTKHEPPWYRVRGSGTTWDGWDLFQQYFGNSCAFYRIVFVIFLYLNGFERKFFFINSSYNQFLQVPPPLQSIEDIMVKRVQKPLINVIQYNALGTCWVLNCAKAICMAIWHFKSAYFFLCDKSYNIYYYYFSHIGKYT